MAALSFPRTGSASAPITLAAYPGETPIIDGRNRLSLGVLVRAVGGIVVDGLTFTRFSASTSVILIGDGFNWENPYYTKNPTPDIVVRNVTITDCGYAGIDVQPSAERAHLHHNDVSHCVTGIRNNILESRGMIWQVMKALDPTAIVDNNLYYNAGAYFGEWAGQGLSTLSAWQSYTRKDGSSLYGDPRFVSPTGGDFHLLPDSLAIDRGAVLPGVTDGYLGTAPDIGRFEYGGTQ